MQLSRADYRDRVEAVWTAQIVAVLLAWPHEHQVASTLWLTNFPKRYTNAPVDDDWYYEMCALRGFEKYGIGMTVEQLGQQWLENRCGSWGSSEQARLNLERGVKAPDCGHPRYNKLWFTIGPQFSSDVYGALAPGIVNVAARMARELGHVNGFAEGTDGAVFMAGMISLAFVEPDSKQIVRKAAQILHPDSPYRQCLDLVIELADAGRSFEEICQAVEDRWHIEYPATNNAVPNGGLVAASVWFGEGDFLKTINLAARAADFTDADCNAANAAAVVGAMHGMKAIPPHLVGQLGDRIVGAQMGSVKFDPPVDEKISELAKRTVAIGEKVFAANGGKLAGENLVADVEPPKTQPAELFELADLMQFWNSAWTLERAGFGGAGGGMAGIRGITHLAGDVLATYPRDEVRGLVLRHTAKLGSNPMLRFDAGADAGRAWELNV
ncbi:MAG: ADP-ribosylglycohydrolase family protein, partial [Verrucomicrobia subdivision 3 bacterium]|nr:ADP-ribosylglycohydrolase family protein [Limisphaerales bacterium]